ncbi:MAG: aquaporin [archaeon]|nr:aquaporin [archaeon]
MDSSEVIIPKDDKDPEDINAEEIQPILKRAICEGIGMFAMTFIACGVGVNIHECMTVSVVFGCIYIAIAYSIGINTGCHINPCISLNFLFRKKLNLREFFFYIGAQFIGALLGSFFLGLCMRFNFKDLYSNTIQDSLYKKGKDGQPETKDFYSYLSAVLVEGYLSFFFIMAVNGTRKKKFGNRKYAGLVNGIVFMSCISFGLDLTSGSLNPFRSLAPALLEAFAGETEAIKEIWVYILGPLGGASISALWCLIYLNEDKVQKQN